MCLVNSNKNTQQNRYNTWCSEGCLCCSCVHGYFWSCTLTLTLSAAGCECCLRMLPENMCARVRSVSLTGVGVFWGISPPIFKSKQKCALACLISQQRSFTGQISHPTDRVSSFTSSTCRSARTNQCTNVWLMFSISISAPHPKSLKAVVTPESLMVLDFRGLGLERWLVLDLAPQLASQTHSLPFEFRALEAILQHKVRLVLCAGVLKHFT